MPQPHQENDEEKEAKRPLVGTYEVRVPPRKRPRKRSKLAVREYYHRLVGDLHSCAEIVPLARSNAYRPASKYVATATHEVEEDDDDDDQDVVDDGNNTVTSKEEGSSGTVRIPRAAALQSLPLELAALTIFTSNNHESHGASRHVVIPTTVDDVTNQPPPPPRERRRATTAVEEEDVNVVTFRLGKRRLARAGVTYRVLCCTLRGNAAVALYSLQIVLAAICFGAAIQASWGEPGYEWAGVAFWKYAVFLGIFFIAPLVTSLIIRLGIFVLTRSILRAARATFSTTAVGKVRAAVEYDERIVSDKRAVIDFVSFLEDVHPTVNRLAFTFVWFIAFASCFAGHPTTGSQSRGFDYTSCALATLTIWCLAQVLTKLISHRIARSVSLSSLGAKMRRALFRQLVVMRLMGLEVGTSPITRALRSLSEEPDVALRPSETYIDPRKIKTLATTLAAAKMAGKRRGAAATESVQIVIVNERDARLVGGLIYRLATSGDEAKEMRKRFISVGRRRGRRRPPPFTLHDFEMDLMMNSSSPSTFSSSASDDDDVVDDGYHARDANPPPAREFFTRSDVMETLRAAASPPLEVSTTTMNNNNNNPTIDLDRLKLSSSLIEDVWEMFEPYGRAKCYFPACRECVVELLRSRRNLSRTHRNTQAVVLRLESVISAALDVVVFLCALWVFGLNVTAVYTTISATILAFSFIFGGTLAGILNSVVFQFGISPFAVGDVVKFGTDETKFVVEELSLFATTLLREDGARVKYNNSSLLSAQIVNVPNSGPLLATLRLKFPASSAPTTEDLVEMEGELEEFVESKRASFSETCSMAFETVEDAGTVRVRVRYGFAYNDTDVARTERDRSALIGFVLRMLERRGFKDWVHMRE